MIKIMLVDDEVLALEYLKNLIDWEKYGYEVVAGVTSGKKALENFTKYSPDIVVSDIRMPGMDGLELARKLKEEKPEVIVILLSAYKDFEYAKKGIQYGVENYLLKHELSEETLVHELELLKNNIVKNTKKKKIYKKYFMNQLIYQGKEDGQSEDLQLGNRLFLVMVHRDSLFFDGNFYDQALVEDETERSVLEETLEDTIFYVSDVKITQSNQLFLFRIENSISKYKINTLIEKKCREMLAVMEHAEGQSVNLLYSYEIRQNELSEVFQKMAGQIRYSVFWKKNDMLALNRIKQTEIEEKIIWGESIRDLEESLSNENSDYKEMIHYIFEQVVYPVYRLDSFREVLHLLENVIRKREKTEGIMHLEQEQDLFKADEIEAYYIRCYEHVFQKINEKERQKYSNIVIDMMRYIRNNFQYDLNLDLLGDVFHMNGVYLGQVFKKEVGVTFLKYLTSVRIEEAKRLLEKGQDNISEVAEKVGYKTSQYFSQIFYKSVGMKPQEYRKWSKKGE